MPRISLYTPLVFPDLREGIDADGYSLVFAPSDRIVVEAFSTEAQSMTVSPVFGGSAAAFSLDAISIGTTQMRKGVITGLPDGVYIAEIDGCGKSLPFEVTADSHTLANTLLLQYSEPDNRSTTEAAFVIGGQQEFFDLRLQGGFRLPKTEFAVDNEQFCASTADVVELSASEYCVRTALIGCADGVPPYVGEMAVRAMACTCLYVNGRRHVLIGGGLESEIVHGERMAYSARLRASERNAASEIELQRLILRDTGEHLRHDEQNFRTPQR